VRIELRICKLLLLAIILNVCPKWVISSYLPLESNIFGPCGQNDVSKLVISEVLMFSVHTRSFNTVSYLEPLILSYRISLSPEWVMSLFLF
jgi:hypothetical protein